MTQLSVNINKVATVRNARGGNLPDVVKFALDCERFGAQGITVHPRPDERHSRYKDVYDLKPVLTTEFNIEGNPIPRFVDLVKEFKACGIRVSIFIDANPTMIEMAAKTGTDRVELYTEAFAREYHAILSSSPKLGEVDAKRTEECVRPFVEAARVARDCGLGLNAGHDLSLENLAYFHQQIPWCDEVSIGHALISDALYLGIEETIHRYLDCLK